MLARDIMTRKVVTVSPQATLAAIARALLDARVSAVPVVDEQGRPLGVVSEWDLIGLHVPERVARRDHWLSRLAEGHPLSSDYLAIVEPTARTAAEVMTKPAITIDETADLPAIAGILGVRKVKRVFVVADERLVGVVSRADLARALMLPAATTPERAPLEAETPTAVPAAAVPAETVPATVAAAGSLTAAGFRRLVEDHEDAKRQARVKERQAHDEARKALIKKLAGERLSERAWTDLLERARSAAERGEKDFLLMRFPAQLCSDGGRRINVPDPDWPKTLRGPAADVYEHWRDELKEAGFGLVARILEFPGGFPGDAGLTLTWGA